MQRNRMCGMWQKVYSVGDSQPLVHLPEKWASKHRGGGSPCRAEAWHSHCLSGWEGLPEPFKVPSEWTCLLSDNLGML